MRVSDSCWACRPPGGIRDAPSGRAPFPPRLGRSPPATPSRVAAVFTGGVRPADHREKARVRAGPASPGRRKATSPGAAGELYGPLAGPPTHVTSGSQSMRGSRPSRCRRPRARATSPGRSPSPARLGSTAPNSVLPPSSRRRGLEAQVPFPAAAPHSYLHRLHPPDRLSSQHSLSSFQRNFLPPALGTHSAKSCITCSTLISVRKPSS